MSIGKLLAEIDQGRPQSVYLVHGDQVLAEPEAVRLAEALAKAAGCEVESRRHPPQLSPVLDDLRTFSLFATAKVILAVDTAVLADRSAAADLVDQAEKALPAGEGELSARGREGASRLLQALRLFGIDPAAGQPAEALDSLPEWVLQGGQKVRRAKPRGRTKKEVAALTEGLVELLAAAREAGLHGWAEGDLAELATVIREGLPPGHALVLAERSAAKDHPLVRELVSRGAVIGVGGVVSDRKKGWQGLDAVAEQLAKETGIGIAANALAELARRTLKQEGRGGGGAAAGAESTARLAGEYRKLSHLAQGQGKKQIDRQMVQAAVEDRGEEDVWKLLDSIGSGRAGDALDRLRRLLAAAPDPVGARLGFFGLLAALCRHITAIRGLMQVHDIPAGVGNFKTFETRWAPRLQGALPTGEKSPLAGLKAYRLFKAYQAACNVPEEVAASLPWEVLRTELGLKGESDDPDATLAQLITLIGRPAAAGRRPSGPQPRLGRARGKP